MAVYYLCPDATSPSGGIRVIYEHVDLLNRNGIEAAVVHEFSGFRCTWFANETRVLGWTKTRTRRPARVHEWRRGRRYGRDVDRRYRHLQRPTDLHLSPDDVLVAPGSYGAQIHSIAPGTRKVIFSLGAGHPPPARSLDASYRHPDIVGVMVGAEEARDLLSWAFPGLVVHLVPFSVDQRLFHFRERKEHRIAFMPRRNEEHARLAFRMLATRGTLGDFQPVPIDGRTFHDAAEIVGTSLIFLAVSPSEGFGLPPAEAMACGSIVVGYDAVGGREFMRPDVCFPVTTGDVLALAQELERVIALEDQDPEMLRARGRAAHDLIAGRYSLANEERELLMFWNGILGR